MLHIMKYPLRMMAVYVPYFTIIMRCLFILIITMSCGDVEESVLQMHVIRQMLHRV